MMTACGIAADLRFKLEHGAEVSPMKLPRGIYETEYGNAAYVYGPDAKTAWDIDMGERIPIEMVTDNLLRECDEDEEY
jgi:hypothetical protein